MTQRDYSIGDTAKITGVSQKQLRNWEAKGLIPKADRVVSGDRSYRRFSLQQLETIRAIKEFLDDGYHLRAACQKVIGKIPSKKEVKKDA